MPNVWFDTASLPSYFATEGFPWPTAGRLIREACERIGPAKLLFGSDIPGTLPVASYLEFLAAARVHLAFLPAPEQQLVLGETARHVYR